MANGITAAEAIQAAKDSQGFVTTIAKRLGCERTYIYKLQEKYPTFKQAILEEREGLKDDAEGALQQQIREGNMTAIIFYLKTQARDRGYIDKQEVSILLKQEVDKFLDVLEKSLSPQEYRNVLDAISNS